jgi:hypothetical protein
MYAQNAMMVNEFLGNSWNKVISETYDIIIIFHFKKCVGLISFSFQLQITPYSNVTLGVQCLKSRGFFTHAYWYWIGVGALIGYIFLHNFLYTIALTYLDREYLYICLFIKILIVMKNVTNTYTCFFKHLTSNKQQ